MRFTRVVLRTGFWQLLLWVFWTGNRGSWRDRDRWSPEWNESCTKRKQHLLGLCVPKLSPEPTPDRNLLKLWTPSSAFMPIESETLCFDKSPRWIWRLLWLDSYYSKEQTQTHWTQLSKSKSELQRHLEGAAATPHRAGRLIPWPENHYLPLEQVLWISESLQSVDLVNRGRGVLWAFQFCQRYLSLQELVLLRTTKRLPVYLGSRCLDVLVLHRKVCSWSCKIVVRERLILGWMW